MMGSICCFLSPIMDSPMSTMTSCRSNASDGGSVMSSFSPGVAIFIQASSAITATVATWAMHMRRTMVAKASFSFSSANEAGTNILGPSTPIIKGVGDIFPLLRMQNSA